MAFLYQVLKDVSEKHPYNVGKETLNSVSNEIKKHLCSGHEGFKTLFAELPDRIAAYNSEVRQGNERVKRPIKEMIEYVNNRGEFLVGVNKIQVEKITEHNDVEQAEKMIDESLKECQQKAAEFNEKYNLEKQTDMKNAISDLNSTLSERVHVALKAVSHETERLKTLSGKERKDLDGLQEKIKIVLNALGNCVNEKIQKDIQNLVKQLKEGVKTILGHLKDIDDRLREYVQKLEEWMESAKKEIDRIRNEDVKKIIDETTDSVTGKKYLIEKDAEKLINWKESLSGEIQRVKGKLAKLVQEALGQIKSMDGKLKEDLYRVKTAVERQVTEVKNKIGKLYDKVKNGDSATGAIAEGEWKIEKFLEHIRNKVGSIEGTASGRNTSTGLLGFKQKLNTYLKETYAGDAFGRKIVEWIDEIVNKDTLVRDYYYAYVSGSPSKFKNEYKRNNSAKLPVLEGIKNRVKEILQSADSSNMQAGSTIQETLTKIKAFLGSLATTFEKQLTTSQVNSITSAIEDQLLRDGILETKSPIYTSELSVAVDGILQQIHGRVAGAAKKIGDILERCQVSNIDNALNAAGDIFENLKTALARGSSKQSPAAALDAAIDGVTETLEEKLKPNGGKTVTLDKDTTFTGYNGFVDQDPKKLESLSTDNFDTIKGAGSLPAAIGEIGSEAQSIYLDHITQGLTSLSDKIKEHLGIISQAITTTTTNVQSKLDDFKNKKIGNVTHSMRAKENTLQELHCKFVALQKYFETKALKTAEAFAAYADRAGDNIINPLKQHVNNEVKKAQDSIIAEAKKNYISSIQSLLQRFASKVHGELETLPKSIEDDSTLGFKGLMVKFEKSFITNEKSIKGIKDIETASPQKESPLRQAATKFFGSVNRFLHGLEIQPDFKTDYEKIKPTRDALAKLFGDLVTSQYFDHEFSRNLSALKVTLNELNPATYGEAKCPLLLNALNKGLTNLVSELGKAYISSYDSETFGAELVEKDKLTPYGTKLSKVCLTVVSTSYNVLNTVRKYSATTCRSDKIHQSTPIGQFLGNNGYIVSKDKQDGHLRNGDGMLGWHVYKSLVKDADGRVYRHHDADRDTGPLEKLHEILQTYYRIGHISTFSAKKLPCSIFEMLCWIVGLPCTSAYDEMFHDAVSDLFVDPSKRVTVGDLDAAVVGDEPVASYPEAIELERTQRAVERLCSRSYDVLLEIVGYGNAYTTYAVDYCDNSLQLSYPSDPSQCLELLLDILRRLLPVFRFLHSQCKMTAEHRGWSDCWYGKDVMSAKWPCNDHASEKATCQPNDQPKCQARCQGNCHPTSPLQSYLSDCLLGYLPHQVSSIGCKTKCATCPKSLPGQPCITPLGFRGFSGSTKTGKDLCRALTKFFVNVQYSSLLCLMPKPPSTLPEHYQFVSTLVRMLDSGKGVNGNAVKTAFETATKELSIELYKDTSDFTNALQKAYCSHRLENHKTYSEADLSTLSAETNCTFASSDKIHCAPYLRSLCDDSYTYLAEKHSKLYFSWALYLPLTLYDYLKSLFDSFSNISCRDWGCSPCTHGTKCSRGKHGVENCQCRGLVECRGVSSTFYSYGFTFGDSTKLHGDSSKSYCHHFYIQLKNVLQSTHFTALFKECDNYMWMIRQPFIWLNVALWSLSLFYLICVMVGRLDVLHIRSHLRSPSSHRITAQSLLAAAQVGRLAKISYLQP